MKRPDAITEDDLHAYVDGLLSDDDRAAVEAWLAERPEEQARVQDWKQQAEILRNAFASYAAAHPHDASMLSPPKPDRAWRLRPALLKTAAALMIFAAGAAELTNVLQRAQQRGVRPHLYTKDLFATGNDTDNRAAVAAVATVALDLVGLGLHAERKEIDKIIKGLKLHG